MNAITYDPDAVHLEYAEGDHWHHLAGASLTLTQSYEVSERGVLIPGVDTLDITVSKWVSAPFTLLPPGSVVRLTYEQPGLDELYRGVVTGSSIHYTADPEARRHGHTYRADYQIASTSLAASRLNVTVTWKTLPAETVTARLSRWLDTIDLHGVPDAVMPPESAEGATSLMEIVRAACDYLGVPVRLVNHTDATEIHAVPASTTLPNGITDADAASMYSSADVATSAGDREVSFDPDDVTRQGSATLVNDDVRVLSSPWRIPDPLPIPFADPAPVASFTQTFTPFGYSASLAFSYATAHKIRYRPPVAYVPGNHSTTRGHGGSTGATGGNGDDGDDDQTSTGTQTDGTTIGSITIGGGAKYVLTGHLRLNVDPGFSGEIRIAIAGHDDLTGGITVHAITSAGYDLGERCIDLAYGGGTLVPASYAFTIPGPNGQHVQFAISGQLASADGGGPGGPVSLYWEATDTGVIGTVDDGGIAWTPLTAPAAPDDPGDGDPGGGGEVG